MLFSTCQVWIGSMTCTVDGRSEAYLSRTGFIDHRAQHKPLHCGRNADSLAVRYPENILERFIWFQLAQTVLGDKRFLHERFDVQQTFEAGLLGSLPAQVSC